MGIIATLWKKATATPNSWVRGLQWSIPCYLLWMTLAFLLPMMTVLPLRKLAYPEFETSQFFTWISNAGKVGKNITPQFIVTAVLVYLGFGDRKWALRALAAVGWFYGRGHFYVGCVSRWASGDICHPIEEIFLNSSTQADFWDFFTMAVGTVAIISCECWRFRVSTKQWVLWMVSMAVMGSATTLALFFITFINLERVVPLARRRQTPFWWRFVLVAIAWAFGTLYYNATFTLTREADAHVHAQSLPFRDLAEEIPAISYSLKALVANETPTGTYVNAVDYLMVYIQMVLFVGSIHVKPRKAANSMLTFRNKAVAELCTWMARFAAVYVESVCLGSSLLMWFFMREWAPSKRITGIDIPYEETPLAVSPGQWPHDDDSGSSGGCTASLSPRSVDASAGAGSGSGAGSARPSSLRVPQPTMSPVNEASSAMGTPPVSPAVTNSPTATEPATPRRGRIEPEAPKVITAVEWVTEQLTERLRTYHTTTMIFTIVSGVLAIRLQKLLLFKLVALLTLTTWVLPTALRAFTALWKAFLEYGDRPTAAMYMAVMLGANVGVLLLSGSIILGGAASLVALIAMVAAARSSAKDRTKNLWATAMFFPRFYLPLMSAVRYWDKFVDLFTLKYSAFVAVDVFRSLRAFQIATPTFIFLVMFLGVLGMWLVHQRNEPPFSRVPGNISYRFKAAVVVYFLLWGYALKQTWPQTTCKLIPGEEYPSTVSNLHFSDFRADEAVDCPFASQEAAASTGDDEAKPSCPFAALFGKSPPLKKLPSTPEEEALADGIGDIIRMNKRVSGGPTAWRAQHAKSVGCVRGKFEVAPHISPNLRHGVFQPGSVYDAVMRFSNGHTRVAKDTRNDARGFAIKLLNVTGERAPYAPPDELFTQDFIMLSSQIFFTGDTDDYIPVMTAATSPNQGRDLLGFVIPSVLAPSSWRVDQLVRLEKMGESGEVPSPLTIPYYSTTPYRLGDEEDRQAVKYMVRPCEGTLDEDINEADEKAFKHNPSGDYLRDAMQRRLAKQDVCMEFLVQEQGSNACKNKIEDPTVPWDTPYTVVARLTIPKQPVGLRDQHEWCENLAFNPHHALAVHRPLGAINHARAVYHHSAVTRHVVNKVFYHEPTPTSSAIVNGFNGSPMDGVKGGPFVDDLPWADVHPCCPDIIRTASPLPAEQQIPVTKIILLAEDFLNSLMHYAHDFAVGWPELKIDGGFTDPDEYAYWFNSTSAAGTSALAVNFPSSQAAADHWKEDAFWARQFITGIHPLMITFANQSDLIREKFSEEGLATINDWLQKNEGATSSVNPDGSVEMHLGTTTWESLVADRRLFYADYSVLDDISTKPGCYLYSPFVLLYTASSGDIMPLAVQLYPGEQGLFVPDDTPAWLFCKMHVSQSDATVHESISHLGTTHLAMSGVIVAAARQLARDHAVYALMEPFTRQTLGLTQFSMDTLIKADDVSVEMANLAKWALTSEQPPSVIDSMAVGLEGIMKLIEKDHRTHYNLSMTWPEEMMARGFGDPASKEDKEHGPVINGFYYRDDAYIAWAKFDKFVRSALRQTYPTDASVAADEALQRFAADMGEAGARIRGAPTAFTTFDQLVTIVTKCIFTMSVQHTAINFPQLQWYGFIPNRPYTLLQPMPADRDRVSMLYITEALPSDPVDVVKYIATNKLLSRVTDVPLRSIQLDKPGISLGYQEHMDRLIEDLSKLGCHPEVDGISYNVLNPENLACSICL